MGVWGWGEHQGLEGGGASSQRAFQGNPPTLTGEQGSPGLGSSGLWACSSIPRGQLPITTHPKQSNGRLPCKTRAPSQPPGATRLPIFVFPRATQWLAKLAETLAEPLFWVQN